MRRFHYYFDILFLCNIYIISSYSHHHYPNYPHPHPTLTLTPTPKARETVMKACREYNIVMRTFPDPGGQYDAEEWRVYNEDHVSDLQYEGNGFWRKDRNALLDHTSISVCTCSGEPLSAPL